MNTAADLELEGVLSAAGIPAAYFDVQSFEDYLNMLDICTRLTGERENYEKYGLAVREEIDAAKERADGQRAHRARDTRHRRELQGEGEL